MEEEYKFSEGDEDVLGRRLHVKKLKSNVYVLILTEDTFEPSCIKEMNVVDSRFEVLKRFPISTIVHKKKYPTTYIQAIKIKCNEKINFDKIKYLREIIKYC